MALFSSVEVHAEDFWINAEYLNWKIQDAKKVIPLVVQGATVPDMTPILDNPGSEVVLGDQHIDSKWRSGGRFTLGFICGDMCQVGVEASYFFLGRSGTEKSVFSDGALGSPFLSIPFIDSNTGLESSFAIARPGSFNGTATLKVANSMQGAELYSLTHLPYLRGWSMNVFGGFRYLNFNEKLQFNTESLFINPALNDVYSTSDRFNVDNNFYGGSLGASAIFSCHHLLFSVKAKIGAGAIYQSTKIRGRFDTNNYSGFTIVQTFDGGYFALPSNSGTKRRPKFSVIPEVEVNFGYEIIENLALNVGYNFLYVTNVLRALRQLDRHINPTGSPLYEETSTPVQIGASRPKSHMRSSDLWVQGVNAGIVYVF
jgi:hypothetical protein